MHKVNNHATQTWFSNMCGIVGSCLGSMCNSLCVECMDVMTSWHAQWKLHRLILKQLAFKMHGGWEHLFPHSLSRYKVIFHVVNTSSNRLKFSTYKLDTTQRIYMI